MNCPICDSTSYQDLVYRQGAFRCLSCGALYRTAEFDYTFYERVDYWYKGDEELKLAQRAYFAYFQDYIKQGPSIEFGAADGDFTCLLRAAVDSRHPVYYSELKDMLRPEYEALSLAKVIGTIDDVKPPEPMDNIVMVDVIEHLNNIVENTKKLRDMLAPSGRLFLVTTDGDGLHAHDELLYHQEHTCIMGRKAVNILCKKTGLNLLRYWTSAQGLIYLILERNND